MWSPATCQPHCVRRMQWELLQMAKQQKCIIAPVCKDSLAIWIPLQAWAEACVEKLKEKVAVADCICAVFAAPEDEGSEFELDLFG